MLIFTCLILLSIILSWPMGYYLTWVVQPNSIGRFRLRFELATKKLLGQFGTSDQSVISYIKSLLLFNVLMFVYSFTILKLQNYLPLNPDHKEAVETTLAFHTAASFTSNTNLQHYSGEVTLSYYSQLFALMWLQFVSAASGIASLAALSRALKGNIKVGNFFTDVFRILSLLLVPLSIILSIFLLASGVPMTFAGAAKVSTLEGVSQTIARGPVVVFTAIKQLGTNGGGFFGTNSAHPFENPSYWSNIISNFAILIIPMGSVWMFGLITQRIKHAAVVFAVMLLMYLGLLVTGFLTENAPAPALSGLAIEEQANLEGKELRFGPHTSSLWAISTTATSNGSVNSMHDSLNPLTGLLSMIGMWLNVIFGGAGVGLINMFLFIIVSVFIAGMMIGRTPEYLNRKIEIKEVKLALFTLLLHPLFILSGVAVFAVTSYGLDSIQEPGHHGFSEIVYEFSSAAANNGSGFEGLGDNTPAWNITTGIIMLLARYLPIITPLLIANSLATKKACPETSGTLKVDTTLFGLILFSTVIIISALLFMPLAVLGPIAEHLSTGDLSTGVTLEVSHK